MAELTDILANNDFDFKSLSVPNGDVYLGASTSVFIGDSSTDGSWRYNRVGNELWFERRESGVWVFKGSICKLLILFVIHFISFILNLVPYRRVLLPSIGVGISAGLGFDKKVSYIPCMAEYKDCYLFVFCIALSMALLLSLFIYLE